MKSVASHFYFLSCLLSVQLFCPFHATSQQMNDIDCYTVNLAVGTAGYAGTNYIYHFHPSAGIVEFVKNEQIAQVTAPELLLPDFLSTSLEEKGYSSVFDGNLYDGSYGTLDYNCYSSDMFKSHTLSYTSNVYLKMDGGIVIDSGSNEINSYWMISCNMGQACTSAEKSTLFVPQAGYIARDDIRLFNYDAILGEGSAHDTDPRPDIGLLVVIIAPKLKKMLFGQKVVLFTRIKLVPVPIQVS